MAQLILRDRAGHDVAQRYMEPQERYDFYTLWNQGELLVYDHKRYVVHSLAWRRPEQELVICATFDSYAPVEYFDD